MRNRMIRGLLWLAALCAVSAAVCIFSMSVGSGGVPVSRIPSIIFGSGDATEHTIMFGVRLPRILLGLAVGGALGLAGVILQGMFHNPLVEPYTLGISGGAALGVCVNIMFRLGDTLGLWSLPLCGFAGAAATIIAGYILGARKGGFNVRDLLLTGVMISFICSSLVMLLMAVSRTEDLHGIVFWIMGSLQESNPFLVKLALAVSILCLGCSYLFCLDLNALSLGEEEAMHLGINVESAKRLFFLLASLATGLAVSVAGVIGFIGLVIPHFMRRLLGSDHRLLLMASWICGGAFLVFCDTLARTVISPLELPVGVITGLIGGSIFVYALGRKPVLPGGK